MPEYNYKCNDCSAVLKKEHGMKELLKECPACDSPVGLKRMPSNFLLNSSKKEEKVGDLVKRSIEGLRRDLDEEKKSLKETYHD